MALTLAEGLVMAIKNYVETNLPAKLTMLNGEYNDGITLENTIKTYLGVKSLKSIGGYPVLYIFSPSQRFSAHRTTQGESMPEISVGIVVMDQDSETLQKRLYRYGRALIELMLATVGVASNPIGWLLGTDEVWEVDTVSAEFTESGQSSFVGEITLTLRALKVEMTT